MKDEDILKILLKKNKTIEEKLLRQIIELLRNCTSTHKKYGIDEIQSWIINPLLEGKLFYLEKNEKIVGIATYATISKNIARKWFTEKQLSEQTDWNSGNEIWWIDCLSPYGYTREICKLLRTKLRSKGYRKKHINHIRVYKDGTNRINKSML